MATDNRNILLNSKGVSLFLIVFVLFLVLTLISAGLYLLGPRIVRAKQTTTINTLESAVNAIISWSQANNFLPTALSGVVKNPNDAYRQPLYYIFDNDLTAAASGGLCGKSTAYITANYCADAACNTITTSIPNVAFIVLSKGYNHVIQTDTAVLTQTTLTDPITATKTVNIYSPTLTIGNYPYDDIVRLVTLNELQSRAGCAGVTGGGLMILNNELPRACSSNAYAAIVNPSGGVPPYNWCISGNLPNGITSPGTNCPNWYSGATLSFAGSPQGITGGYPITVMLKDSASSPATVQRNYVINVFDCSKGSGGGWNLFGGNWNPFGTMLPGFSIGGPGPSPNSTGGQSQITPGTAGSPNTGASAALAQNVVTNTSSGGTTPVVAIQNNVLAFGNNVNNGAGCVWYPYNFPLVGKTLRAFWNFCFKDIETADNGQSGGSSCPTCKNCVTTDTGTPCPFCFSCPCAGCSGCTPVCPTCSGTSAGTSTCFADGYTFTLMQAANPNTYCGTGSAYDSVLNPFYNCSDKSPPTYNNGNVNHLGEFMSYCGLPGRSIAIEFDIYPNNTNTYGSARNDPSNNHVAIVQSISTHTSGDSRYSFPAGTYGDNTHGVGGNPSCTTSNSGTSGCLYGAYKNSVTQSYATWMEDGCNSGYTSHNARVEVHTHCNSSCTSCGSYTSNEAGSYTCSGGTSSSPYAFVKVWIDKGNSVLTSDASSPDVSYCLTLPAAMNQVKLGFTQGTGASEQLGYIANFAANFAGNCTLPTISPTSLPSATVGTNYAVQLSTTGTPSSWGLSAANIPGVTASTVPSWLSLNISGTCGSYTCTNTNPCLCGTPPTSGMYNAILISLTDTCNSDGTTCNTISNTYTIAAGCPTLSITTASPLPGGNVGTAYSATLASSGSTAPLSWVISSGSLPPGLSLTGSTGVIGGTPTTTGTYTFTVQLTDSCGGGRTVSQTLTMTVVCSGYRVWNHTSHHYDFQVSGATCNPDVSDGSEITDGTYQLTLGNTITRYDRKTTCGVGNVQGRISYSQAVSGDANGDCQVCYDAGDTVGDRTGGNTCH